MDDLMEMRVAGSALISDEGIQKITPKPPHHKHVLRFGDLKHEDETSPSTEMQLVNVSDSPVVRSSGENESSAGPTVSLRIPMIIATPGLECATEEHSPSGVVGDTAQDITSNADTPVSITSVTTAETGLVEKAFDVFTTTVSLFSDQLNNEAKKMFMTKLSEALGGE